MKTILTTGDNSIALGNAYIDTIMMYSAPRLYKLFYGSTGISDIARNIDMQVFPNPATSELTVSINPEQKPVAEIRLFDVTGRAVTALENLNVYSKNINVNDLTNGIYFVNLKLTDGTSATQKMTIQ